MSDGPFQRRGPRRIGRASDQIAAPTDSRGSRQRPSDGGGSGDVGGSGGRGRRRDWGPIGIGFAVVALAVAMIVLFVPPIALLDQDEAPGVGVAGSTALEAESPGDEGIKAESRERLPDVPDNLLSMSPIYDLSVPEAVVGPFVLHVRLSSPTQDQRNLGAYTFRDGLWERLNPAILSLDGTSASVEVEEAPSNLAILRRLQFRDTVTGTLPQDADLAARAVNTLTIINPVGFVPADDGSLLGRVRALPNDVTQAVYPVVAAEVALTDTINTVIASEQLRRQHVNNILLMVQTGRFDGVDIDYQFISPALRDAFSSFVSELAEQLHRDNRGISLHVPLPRVDASGFSEGAYDLSTLGEAADLIKLTPPRDQSIFRETLVNSLPPILNRVPSEKVLLKLTPFSVVRSPSATQLITQREALGLASTLSVREAGPVIAGSRVTLVGNSLFQDGGASGLGWDQFANAVSFVFPDTNGEFVTVWVENRFSIAFKLQLIADFKLGGLALEDVSADPGHADLWDTVNNFLESGGVRLTLPNTELMTPIWEAEEGDLGGSGSAGWVVWTTPVQPGIYEVRLIVSDGDVRVGRAIDIRVEG